MSSRTSFLPPAENGSARIASASKASCPVINRSCPVISISKAPTNSTSHSGEGLRGLFQWCPQPSSKRFRRCRLGWPCSCSRRRSRRPSACSGEGLGEVLHGGFGAEEGDGRADGGVQAAHALDLVAGVLHDGVHGAGGVVAFLGVQSRPVAVPPGVQAVRFVGGVGIVIAGGEALAVGKAGGTAEMLVLGGRDGLRDDGQQTQQD
ncbi:uncharacterized protein PG998_009013 [Apiospora kogelbergensis]|uniref:uncharacterized protein n=1 Tax=Apiospora kogelbergensis TaxID=1337665 RepID=UPI003130979A